MWAFYAENDGAGGLRIHAGWGWGGTICSGPYSTSNVSGKNYSQSIVSIPIGQWVYFEAFLCQSKDFDGRITFWQDGVLLFDFQNVRTSYDNPGYNPWNCCNEWAINNYSDGLDPSPADIYFDDALIVTERSGSTSIRHMNAFTQYREDFSVFQNPFYFSYSIHEPGNTTAGVLNIVTLSGKRFYGVIRGAFSGGSMDFMWHGKELSGLSMPCGIYIFRQQDDPAIHCKRIFQVK